MEYPLPYVVCNDVARQHAVFNGLTIIFQIIRRLKRQHKEYDMKTNVPVRYLVCFYRKRQLFCHLETYKINLEIYCAQECKY